MIVNGESWRQGEKISGTLTVKNHGPSPTGGLRVVLAYADERKLKAKSPDGIEELASKTFESAGPSEWEFQLDPNAFVSDTSGCLTLLYGAGEDLHALGRLKLNIQPRLIFSDFIEVMNVTFRFVVKHIKAGKKGSVEVKLIPPAGPSYPTLEHLILSLYMEGDTVEATFHFNKKGIDASSPGLTLKKEVRKIERSLSPAQYLLSFNRRLNKEEVEKIVEGVIAESK